MGKRMLMSDDDVAAIAYEAFMVGRVYAATGEKETPAEIHGKLMLSVGAALVRHRARVKKERRIERARQRHAP
jgi:hypothetical protein